MPRISSSVNRSPPTSATANMLSRSSWGFLRRSARASAKKRSTSLALTSCAALISSRSVPAGRRMPSFIARNICRSETGQPEQPQEHRGGQGLGQRRRELAGPLVDEPVDELVDQPGDVRLNEVHPLGGEDRVEQLAVLGVLGRVHLQRDERHRLPEIDRLHGRGEDLGMLEGELDLAPAHERRTPEGARDDRPRRPGHLVEGLRVATRLGVGEEVGVEGFLRQILHVHGAPCSMCFRSGPMVEGNGGAVFFKVARPFSAPTGTSMAGRCR